MTAQQLDQQEAALPAEVATTVRSGSEENKTNVAFFEDCPLGDHILGIPSKIGTLFIRKPYLADVESQYGAKPVGFKVYLEPIFE